MSFHYIVKKPFSKLDLADQGCRSGTGGKPYYFVRSGSVKVSWTRILDPTQGLKIVIQYYILSNDSLLDSFTKKCVIRLKIYIWIRILQTTNTKPAHPPQSLQSYGLCCPQTLDAIGGGGEGGEGWDITTTITWSTLTVNIGALLSITITV